MDRPSCAESRVFSSQAGKSARFEAADFAIATACRACEKWEDLSGPHAEPPAIMHVAVRAVLAFEKPLPSGRPSSRTRLFAVQAFLISAVLLGLLVALGIAAIVAVRSWWLDPEADHGDWDSSLVGYKNLRD